VQDGENFYCPDFKNMITGIEKETPDLIFSIPHYIDVTFVTIQS
jgi:hypothetical protein